MICGGPAEHGQSYAGFRNQTHPPVRGRSEDLVWGLSAVQQSVIDDNGSMLVPRLVSHLLDETTYQGTMCIVLGTSTGSSKV